MPKATPHLAISCKTSMHIGKKWSAAHNRRTYDHQKWNRDGHIVSERSSRNVTLCDTELRSWFHQTFDAAITAFNEKNAGKHNDRLITSDAYYQEQKGRVQECIIQLGDHAAYLDMVSKVGQDIADDMHIRFLTEAYQQWIKENPSLRVFSAIIHMDETKDGTPHLHLDFVPVAESKRGLSVKVSMDGAMKALGFDRRKGQKYAETPYKQWLATQRERVESLAAKYVDLIPSEHNTGKQHVETWEYKSEQARKQAAQLAADQEERAAEIARLEAEKQQLSAELEPLRELTVSTKKIKHAGISALGYVTVKKDDFELLQAQAAAYRANQADMKDLKAAKQDFQQQRDKELDRIQWLRESEQERIIAAEERAYRDVRTSMQQYEKNAEISYSEAERLKEAEKELYQDTIQYREKVREREKAALNEYYRNRDAAERLKRSEAEIERLTEQNRALRSENAESAAAYRREMEKMQEKYDQAVKQQAETECMHRQELDQMRRNLDQTEKENSFLRSRLSEAVSAIVGICQAIGMLTDYRGGKYSENRLDNRQSSLIGTVRAIGRELLSKLGFTTSAKELEDNVKLTEPMERRIEDDLKRKMRSQGRVSR